MSKRIRTTAKRPYRFPIEVLETRRLLSGHGHAFGHDHVASFLSAIQANHPVAPSSDNTLVLTDPAPAAGSSDSSDVIATVTLSDPAQTGIGSDNLTDTGLIVDDG